MHCYDSVNDLEAILDFLNNCLDSDDTEMPMVPLILQCGDGEICFGCGNIITDRYLLKVNERVWHVSCLRCRVCNNPLDRQNSCFVRDDNIYCKLDYSRWVSCNLHYGYLSYSLKTKSRSKWVKRFVATGHHASVGNIGHNSSSD